MKNTWVVLAVAAAVGHHVAVDAASRHMDPGTLGKIVIGGEKDLPE